MRNNYTKMVLSGEAMTENGDNRILWPCESHGDMDK